MPPARPGPRPAPSADHRPAARTETPRRRLLSPLTWRILAVNLLALGVLFAGFVYLDAYRRGLIAAELTTLESKAKLFAAAIAESATSPDLTVSPGLIVPLAQQMVRRLVEASKLRARLFNDDGVLIADSLVLVGPGGPVQIEQLPPPRAKGEPVREALEAYDALVARLWTRQALPAYREPAVQTARDYDEVTAALAGRPEHAVRASGPRGEMMLSVAVPVRRFQPVMGALMLSTDSAEIDAAVLQVRLDIVKWFLVALAVTVLLSIYLSSTIARPIKRLAAAAERVRRDRHRQHTIPDFGGRRDEIGQLARALREMTEALWLRMDAIEQFAADVAHEIKNPLSSLRSAVETAARITDPERRERLMAIILDDVARLDRLISDISDASRLDAELSRADFAPVDVGEMLATLIDVTDTAAAERRVSLRLERADGELLVNGIEGRLVQVFRNLTANALSFSPEGGSITLRAGRDDGMVVVEVLDEGSGIPEGREREIFERFYSLRPKGEAFGVHSGLGLSISKQIVDAHGGSIAAANRRDGDGTVRGARFVVSLPAA